MTVRSTNVLEMADGRVVKRFRSWDRDEHRREWEALELLAEFAPGLAPVPVSADLDGDPPAITMTRLPGEPLAGQQVTARHLDVLADTLNYLHRCVPASALDRVRPQRWTDTERVISWLRARTAEMGDHRDGEPAVRAAVSEAARWLDQAAETAEPPTVVFGQGDGNLGNFLWDASRLRVVDFEDSGRSDRALEAADLTEHYVTVHDAGISADDLLGRFDLTTAESARLLFFRRALAISWLYLVHKRPGRVPPHQAERVLTLLAS